MSMIILNPEQYHKILPMLDEVTINNLFARAVIDRKVKGTVYVDDAEEVKTAYIVHSYGMTLLIGSPANEKFNAAFKAYALNTDKSRNTFEWMQAFPDAWDPVLEELFDGYLIRSSENKDNSEDIIELNTRVNFKFNPASYQYKEPQDPSIQVVRANERMIHEMKGSVVASVFWDSAESFLSQGAGFCVLVNDQLASMAFSSCVHENQLELGIETLPQFRGRNLAEYCCSALIRYSLQNNYEPVWACRLENTGSYKLALKLGFEEFRTLSYYRLGI